MIKTLIKHKLAEVAINNLFNKISMNFNGSPEFYIGQKFNYISFKSKLYAQFGVKTDIIRQCEIIDIVNDHIYITYPSLFAGINPALVNREYTIPIKDIIEYD